MDRTVPAGAALLLDFIASKEAPKGYGTVYGNKQDRLPKPLTTMTLGEVIAAGPSWTEAFGSSAAGRYQFMNATLKGLRTELRLRDAQVFGPDLQDRLGYHLLIRRGYEAFATGTLSTTGFGLRLAQEWASFPVLAATMGSKRAVARGQSYYAGDGRNKALVGADAVEAVLARVRFVAQGAQAPSVTPAAPVSVLGSALPAWLALARAELGTKEAPGAANNPVVVRYYAEAGSAGITKDEVPWCAAFVGAMLRRAALANTGSLMARSYEGYGRHLSGPVFGCVGVKKRGSNPAQGHVGFVVGASPTQIMLLGGNQGDQVSIAVFPRGDFTAFRWPGGAALPTQAVPLPATVAAADAALRAAGHSVIPSGGAPPLRSAGETQAGLPLTKADPLNAKPAPSGGLSSGPRPAPAPSFWARLLSTIRTNMQKSA